MINKITIRLWHSPTFNTWLSYGVKSMSLFVVLPLILKYFSNGEVALWYLFATIISLQGLADFGFKITFIRMIAYAKAGAVSIDSIQSNEEKAFLPYENWNLVGSIYSQMQMIYKWLAALLFLILVSLGTMALIRPISFIENQREGWIAWVLIIIVSVIRLYGNIFSNYLEGLNKIAIVRRIEALTSIGSIGTSLLILVFYHNLLLLVIVNQVWVIVNVIRDYFLCRKIEGGIFLKFSRVNEFDKRLFKIIWQPAWRSGLSGLMSNGLNNLTSLFYAQIGNSSSVASYLLALRIINQLKELSMAPFYSKITLLSTLRVRGELSVLIKLAQKGMFLSNLVFIIGVISVGFFGTSLLELLNSDVAWISQDIWLLLSAAYFVHRFGAMHMQLYMTTNHVISHIADGIAGSIFIVSIALLINRFELYAIPISMLLGYLGFYSWFATYNSLKSMKISFFKFEYKASLLPILLFTTYYLLNLIFNNGYIR